MLCRSSPGALQGFVAHAARLQPSAVRTPAAHCHGPHPTWLLAGLHDTAVGFLMRYLATYPAPTLLPKEAACPQAPLSNGCRFSLECLKLGPPASCAHFSEQTGARCRLLAGNALRTHSMGGDVAATCNVAAPCALNLNTCTQTLIP